MDLPYEHLLVECTDEYLLKTHFGKKVKILALCIRKWSRLGDIMTQNTSRGSSSSLNREAGRVR